MIGFAIPENVSEKLPPCSQCGHKPADGPAPRRRDIGAMGRPWKVHLICMACGGFHEGKTFDDALNRWLDKAPVKDCYQTEQAQLEAIKASHAKWMEGSDA